MRHFLTNLFNISCLAGLLLLLVWPLSATAILRNTTIDDTNGIHDVPDSAPAFSGNSIWRVVTGAGCSECRLHPDPAEMYQGTWHDGTAFEARNESDARVSFNFNGTAVYIYAALALNGHGGAFTETHLSFYIDGVHRGNFDHVAQPSDLDGFLYQELVLSASDLPLGRHGVVIANLNARGPGSVFLFDYAMFTSDVEDPSGTISSPWPSGTNARLHDGGLSKPAVIGLAVSLGIGGALALFAIAWFLLRRSINARQARWKANHDIPVLMSAIGNPSAPSIVGVPPGWPPLWRKSAP